jgi:hypothetical protein
MNVTDAAGHSVIREQVFADQRNLLLPGKLPVEPLSALCLSADGIQRAAFALGVLQALATSNLLGEFHYLSTVSGGGYMGSWLTAWRRGWASKVSANWEQ